MGADYGHHSQCYKKVNILKQKYKEEFVALYPADKNDATLTARGNNEGQLERIGEISMDIPDISQQGIVPVECSHECIPKPSNVPKASFETSTPIIKKMIALSTLSTPTQQENRTTDEPVASCSFSVRDTQQIESQVKGSLTVPSHLGSKREVCIFCKFAIKRVSGKKTGLIKSESIDAINKIKKYAENLQDIQLCDELESFKVVMYHTICKLNYVKSSEKSAEKDRDVGMWQELRQIHKAAFEALSVFIRKEILEKKRIFHMQDLYAKYTELLLEMSDGKYGSDDFSNYRTEHLQTKISHYFSDALTVEQSEGLRNRKIVYSRDIDVSKLLNESIINETAEKNILRDAAYKIRNKVRAIQKNPLPDSPQVEDILNGECEIPEMLMEFVCNLIQGPDCRRKNSNDDLVKIKSVCQDIIYIITKGRVKPTKHLMLGLAMKSLTSSKKVVTILNKYGHSVSYTTAEELETELTYTAFSSNKLIPPGIAVVGGACTHVAFDNYDRFVDTLSGKDTLHDTVGIIYQFPENNVGSSLLEALPQALETVTASETSSGRFSSEKPPRKRRRFEVIPRETVAYYKKSNKAIALLPLQTITEILSDCNSAKQQAVIKDLLWAISLSQISSVPMWVGYNCKTILDNSEKQTLDYLPPINLSPTSYSVVQQTMTLATEIANTCAQDKIVVTYDLAIAKMAMEIQSTDSPIFDKLFINLGEFHMQMAYFKAIGKYIDSCGITDILQESNILASGSLNGFIECKHFNRCKRIHPLTSGALQILHFQRFLSEVDVCPVTLTEDLKSVVNNPVDARFPLNLPPLLRKIVNQYEEFCSLTLSGGHGKTAQFYLQYIEYINLFFRFSRSIRMSDFELYINSIFDMANVFFIFNQPNYARWSLKYLSNLINLKISDSFLLDEFRRGAFGIKRTNGNLARAPVDLTLEQTINADAANFLTGISHFTSSISARQRWAFGHSLRTRIITQLSEEINIAPKDDISHSLEKSRMEKNRKQLDQLVDAIKQNFNPFDPNIDKQELFNISTGRASSSPVASFLLNSNSIGESKKKQFIEQCEENSEHFARPISRNSLLNFTSDCAKKVQKTKNGSKEALIKMERDIFGRLLAVALEQKVDLELCFRYPLSAVPPALCHYTGEMCKTDKSSLAKHLTSKIDSTRPTEINVDVIDGFNFLYLLGRNVPQTFDKIGELILTKICTTYASEIHLIFDTYTTPSIKDRERRARQKQDIPYAIKGPAQTRPTDVFKSLRNYKFKDAVVLFLSEFWENDALVPIFLDKKVLITTGEKCYSFVAVNGHIKKTEETNLTCRHEEADTRIIYHIGKLRGNLNVMMKASDTDILVIVLGNIHKFSNLRIWMTSRTPKKDDYHCINLTDLANTLGAGVCRALPAFHAFTGCDYTAAFHRKGKIRPFQILQKNVKFQTIFAALDEPMKIYDDETIEGIQEYTCLMYDVKNCVSVDSARFQMFQKFYLRHVDKEHFLTKVNGFDSKLIPPCWKTLKQKIMRTSFVNTMWLNATNENCIELKAEACGWILNETLEPLWFQGDPTPLRVEDILHAEQTNSDEDEDFTIDSSDSETE